ncbi:TonB-linked outer membrane protein, SusC/RagA family [Lutibacter maritimus]|uniref:TonB-linked outer membrane protein, SusC/RagA family n=2 Tax=Lutibacter maritimus TaxID=593133 RepID=A0A1I6Q9B6_9FLAO|nr:TonB-linked outer membrane protein, SusC/RagA family [Lutibacter maritimus]
MKNLIKNKSMTLFSLKFNLKMKLTTFLLIISIFKIGANNYAQNTKITLNLQNVTIEKVLNEIEVKTDFKFLFNRNDIDINKIVSVNVDKEKVKNILNNMFLDMPVSFELLDKQIIIKKTLEIKEKNQINLIKNQQIEIKGKVTDAFGTPLPGVNIIIVGTVKGTGTDFDGNFTLEAKEGDIIEFSFIGMKTERVTVGTSTVINVKLTEDSASLDEVVVVGYGTQKKSDVTGAVGQVKAEKLTKVVTTNPMDALQGQVSGVSVTSSTGAPGGVADILIRGIGSFGNNQPLFIVDGIQADPYFIDSKNIESIEVLKDAASGAIYGTKAANGVIIITTKIGKKGKPVVDFESSVSINTARDRMNLLDANGYVKVHKQMYENAGVSLPQYIQNQPNVNTNWIDQTHRGGQLSLMSVRASGATDNVNYSVGGNFADEKGLLIGSQFSKKGIFSNIGINKGKFTINTNLNYSETYQEAYKFSIRETYFISPLIPVFDESKVSGYGYRDGDIPDHRNPIAEDHFIEGYSKLKYFLGNVSVGYELKEGLTAKANFSVSNRANNSFSFHKPFKSRDIDDNPQNEYAFISEFNSEFRRINQEYILNYKFDVDKHSIDLLAGYQRISEPYKEAYVQAEGYKIESEIVNGEIVDTKVPALILDSNFKTLNAFSDGTYSGRGTNAEYSLVSQFGRVNYSFDSKYLLQASLRRDGSSKFGKNNQYGVFPSFALGWKITEEDFMKNQDVFEFLKLRYSWGQAGNDSALGYYDYVALISQGKSQDDGGYVFGNPQTSYIGSIARDLQNDDLQWETNTSSNIGMDFSSLESKLKGSLNYYYTTTSDLLITKVVSPSAGINNPIVNVGEFVNKGFEFELGFINNYNNFNYSAFATFTTINSEVTKLSTSDQVLYGDGLKFGSDHFVNQTKVGYEPGAFFLPVADGIFQNQVEIEAHEAQPDAAPGDIRFIDQNHDGEINEADETYQGTAIPKFEYSLNLSADYNNFDFSIFFQGVGGNKIYNGNSFEMLGMDVGKNFRTETLNAWTPQNTNTNIPRAVLGDPNQNNRASTRFLEDGGYLRVKTIQVGYSLPSEVVESLDISKFRVYITGQNLFTFTNYSGLDPEVAGDILSRGIDRTLYPKYKSLIFGLQLKF